MAVPSASATSDPLDSTGTNASTLSNWAAPYVAPMLGRAQALADTPYQPYDGVRTAGPSALQTQAYGQYGNLKTPDQFGIATGFAQDLMGRVGNNRSFTDQGIASLYMSPYQQQVIDINKREARRQGEISNQGSAAQAVGKGAFGGYRHGLVEAENERNLQQRMGDIQDRGMQDAFTAGRSQFNSEEAQRLQQLTAGTGIAQLLNSLGMNQGNLTLQQLQGMLSAGNTQQTTEQRGLDADYNEYLTQQQYPYKQLDWQRGMLQGLPIATQVSNTQYAPPSTMSQLVGGATAGAGIAGALADGYKAWNTKP